MIRFHFSRSVHILAREIAIAFDAVAEKIEAWDARTYNEAYKQAHALKDKLIAKEATAITKYSEKLEDLEGVVESMREELNYKRDDFAEKAERLADQALARVTSLFKGA